VQVPEKPGPPAPVLLVALMVERLLRAVRNEFIAALSLFRPA
jgi:hypothetical protein